MAQAETGRTLNRRYQLSDLLGEGAAGSVYRAIDLLRGGRQVALKLLNPREASKAARESLRTEFFALSRLQHPGLVDVYDLGIDRQTGRWYMTLEFVDGPSLATWQPTCAEDLVILTVRLLQALDHVHARGFVHADVKPDNILLPGGRPEPRLADFGLAALLDLPASRRGTLPYTAPEVLRGDAPGKASDFYSLGATLFQVAYGHPPFPGPKPETVIEGHLRLEPVFPAEPPPHLPPGLPIILRRLLAKDPAARAASGSEVIAAIRDLTGRLPEATQSDRARGALRTAAWRGRELEGRVLRERLEQLGSEDAEGPILILGPAGMGRTRLLEEARSLAQMEGLAVAGGSGSGGEGGALAPALPWLRDLAALAGADPPAALASLLESHPAESAPVEHAQLHEAAAALARAATDVAPVVLLLDDLHEAHPDLLALIARVVRGGGRLLALLTVRSDQPSAALALAEAMGGEPGATTLRLAPLPDEHAALLATDLLGRGDLPAADAAALIEGLGGSPFLIVESLRALLDSGALAPDPDGRWRLDRQSADSGRLGSSASQAASRIVRALPATAREVIAALCVARGPLSADDMARMLGRPEDAVGRQMIELLDSGLVNRQTLASGSTGYRLAHLGLRDAALADLAREDPAGLSRLHAKRLEGLRAQALADPAELAFHTQAMGDGAAAAELWLTAARRERARGAPASAASHYAEALRLGQGGVFDSQTCVAIWEEMGDVHRSISRPDAAEASYRQALEAASPADVVRLLWKRATVLNLVGQFEASRALAAKALEAANKSGDEVGIARCENVLGTSYAREGEHSLAEGHFRRALDRRRAIGDGIDIAGSLMNLGMVATFQGRLQEGAGLLEESLAMYRRLGDHGGTAMVANNLGIVATGRGELSNAADRFQEAQAAYAVQGALGRRAECLLNLARVDLRLGRFDRAVALAEEALETRRRLGLGAEASEALDMLGSAYRESGRFEAALEAHERALAAARRHQDQAQEGFALGGLALVDVAMGNPGAAAERLQAASPQARGSGRLQAHMERAHAELELARGDAPAARRRARALLSGAGHTLDAADRLDLELMAARAGLAAGEMEGALGELDTLAEPARLAVHPARGWEIQRLRSACLSGVGRERESGEARRAALEAFAALASRLPPEYRTALEATRTAARLRGGDAAAGRVAPAMFLDTMYKVIEALTTVHDPEAMLQRVLELALSLLGAERGLILLFPEDGGTPRVAVAHNVEEETIADAITYSCQVVNQGRLGRSLVSADARDDPRLQNYASVSLFHIRSVICVPLQARGRVIGSVYLDSRQQAIGFGEDDLRFLEAFAQHAATALDNARMLRALQRENLDLRRQVQDRHSFSHIVGRAPAMQSVFRTLESVASSSLPALVRGESGTGKELVARALHYNGPRASHPFLSENCAAFPETLLESQLFGHVRGAFTGASSDRSGLFQEAHGGTLFLDEIGEMSPALQARLTRVLETGELRPVGGAHPVKVDVRLIAATHRDLEGMVRRGSFRQDLLFRLNVISVDLPPLRERREDIPLLIAHFLEELSRELKAPAPGIEDGALELLAARDWPGNVRQLRNEVSRLLVFGHGEVITADDVRSLDADGVATMPEYVDDPQQVLTLKELERLHIQRALRETDGDRTRAARLLQVGRATVFRKIKDYDIDA